MNYRIILDAPFKKEVKRLAKKYPSLKRDLEALQEELLSNPQAGIDLGGGLRKLRMSIASTGRGKSHGARVITFTGVVAIEESEINLLTIDEKAERESISQKEIAALLKEADLL